MKRNRTLASVLPLVFSFLILASSSTPVFAHNLETDTLCELTSLPPAAPGLNVTLQDGDARNFTDPPGVIAYANTQHSAPPPEFTIVTSGTIWRYNQWIGLTEKGNWVKAATTVDTTSLGVQFWGDTNDGWARVLVDDSEVWRGSTYGSDTKYPGGAFVKYLEISGLASGKHTISVDNIGVNGSSGGDDVTIFFFGLRRATPTVTSPLTPPTSSPPTGYGEVAIDIWTNKGGQGPTAPGGTFQVGDETIIYVRATITTQARWTIIGPSTTDSGSQLLQGGETYQFPLGKAEEKDIGQWQLTFEGEITGQVAYDNVLFTVVPSAPIPTPTPSLPSPSTGVEETKKAKFDAVSATELDALIALKMAEGKLAVDLHMDADGDGQVTRKDAQLILDWAIEGKAKLALEQHVVELEMVAPTSFDIPSELITAIATPNEETIIESEGMKLTIPQGAVSEDTEVVVKELKEPPPFLPYKEDYSSALWVMGISKVYDFGPEGLEFQKPVQIALSYDENVLPAGADEKNVVPLYYNGKDWIAMPGAIDTEQNTVSIRTSGFPGQFVVLSWAFFCKLLAVTGVAAAIWYYGPGGEAAVAQWAKDPVYNGNAAEYIRPFDPVVKEYAQKVVAETGKNRYESFTDDTDLKEILKKQVPGDRLIRFDFGRQKKGPIYEISKDWGNDWLKPADYVKGGMKGDCKNIANFYCSIMRNLDINAKCVDGYKGGGRDVWVEVEIGGKPYYIGESGEIRPLDEAINQLKLTRPKGVKGQGFMWDENGQVPYENDWWVKDREWDFVFSCDDCSRFQALHPFYEPIENYCGLPTETYRECLRAAVSSLTCWYNHFVNTSKAESPVGHMYDPSFSVSILSYRTDEHAKSLWPDYVDFYSDETNEAEVKARIQRYGVNGYWETTPEGDGFETYTPSRYKGGRYDGKICEAVIIHKLYKNCIIRITWGRPGEIEPNKYPEIEAARELLVKAVELIEEKRGK